MVLSPCSVLLLCGGQGRRMGGRDKGLQYWQGAPMVSWLAATARTQTDDLIISCNRHHDHYAPYADRLAQDDAPLDFAGPLAGIRQGLRMAHHPYLLVLPCDAPTVTPTLLRALRQRAAERPNNAVVLRQGSQWQPLFSLLPGSLLAPLEQAWQRGERSPRAFFKDHGAVALPWPEQDPQLTNLNTLERLNG